jgi:hypothetical protein
MHSKDEIPWYATFFGEDYLRIYLPFLPDGLISQNCVRELFACMLSGAIFRFLKGGNMLSTMNELFCTAMSEMLY